MMLSNVLTFLDFLRSFLENHVLPLLFIIYSVNKAGRPEVRIYLCSILGLRCGILTNVLLKGGIYLLNLLNIVAS